MPLGPRARRLMARGRVRQQRRTNPQALPEIDSIGATQPGPGNDSGRSEADIRPMDRDEREAFDTSGIDSIGAAASRLGERVGLAPSAPARLLSLGGVETVTTPDPEATRQAAVDRSMAPLSPEQRARVQALPIVGEHEDSPENDAAIMDASARELGVPNPPPRPQLHTSAIDLGGQSLRTQAPQASTPLRAPGVMAGVPEADEDFVLGAEPEASLAPVSEAAPIVEDDEDMIGAVQPKVPTDPGFAKARPDMRDARDQRVSRAAGIAGGIGQALGSILGIAGVAAGRPGLAGLGAGVSGFGNAGAGIAESARGNIEQRAQERIEEQARQQEREQLDFRRQNEERRAGLDERRIAQAEAATSEHARRTSAEFDVDSADAEGLRSSYDALINGLPEEAARILQPWVDLDTSGMNARSMASTIENLRAVIDDERRSNPRAFRQGQRSGGQRRGGRLGGTGGGRGVDYGYGANARAERESGPVYYDPAQGEPPTIVGPDGQVRPTIARPQGAAPTSTAAPRAAGGAPRAPQASQAAQSAQPPPEVANDPAALAQWTIDRLAGGQRPPVAPGGAVDLRARPPTDAEVEADRNLAYQEYLIQGAARRMGVDVNTPRGRAAAAAAVDRGLGEGAEDQLVMTGAGSRERTPQQQAEVVEYVRHYAPVHRREQRLQSLGSELDRVMRGPNGNLIVQAALHANSGVPAAIASSREVTDLRARIYNHLNEYFKTFGGANVTANELSRYYSSFGAGSWAAPPRAFLDAIRRQRTEAQDELDDGGTAYPEGQRLYFESQRPRGDR